MSDAPKADPAAVSQVTLKLRDQGGSEIEFKVKSTTKFSKVAKAYAEKKGLDIKEIRFMFEGQRMRIDGDSTVEEIDLQDGDIIDVEQNQIGGKY
ncbi:ubiquitin-related domain-containing protein [Catenaria anguillulae PL171]|uniref:Ubiquitin-related domain-containing protein n=1 Tax=Catenaria anguillulae PL171 TaxID=765915 RepID=A0A1Y2H7C6_9FUNG|nr:ubiquitin-related domain-containing protein [Catenaria anguillulae PL171]